MKNLKLKGAIAENGYSYQELADVIGCSKQTIQNAVNDQLSLALARKIALALNKSIDELFKGE